MKDVLFGVISLSFLSLILLVGVASAETLNYYYADNEISNNPGLDNFQTYTTIDYRDGMNTDFSNIRMYDSAGNEIPYWIESYTNSTSAKVWYQIDAGTVSVQCRWGIANETADESNGVEVFPLLFDSFSGSSVNSSTWNTRTGSGSLSVSSGYLTLNGGSSATSGINGIKSVSQVAGIATITEFRIKRSASSSNWKFKITGVSNGVLNDIYTGATGNKATTNNEGTPSFSSSGDGSNYQTTTLTDTTSWIIESFAVTGSSAIYQRDRSTIATHSTYYPTNASYVQAGVGNNAGSNALQIDWVLTRKYAATEPTTTMGTTQTDITSNTFADAFRYGDFDILGFAVSPFTSLLGDYFYLIFGAIPVFMMYLKAQDIAIPLISGLLFTAAFGMAFPETGGVAILMLLGTGIGAMLFKVFKGSGD